MWSDGMPLTISYLNILNKQQPAKRFQDTIMRDGFSDGSKFDRNRDLFVSEKVEVNGNCFIWSSNVLVFNAWLPINCSTKVNRPFIICEKKLDMDRTNYFYKRSTFQCNPMYIEFNGYCIMISKRVSNHQITRFSQNSTSNDKVLIRLLTAWTMPLYTGQKRQTINIVKWHDKYSCECYTSFDTFYMDNKSWHNNNNCTCNMNYSSLIIVPKIKAVVPNHLFSCKDGNFILMAYLCDTEDHCRRRDDERKCFHICSNHSDCTKGCISPNCICKQLYHQCTLGGCVHQTFVCDGVVHCPADDSDELMCQYQFSKKTLRNLIFNNALSLCNSFSNERYPNNEICLLTRDQYGVTEHCSNTEHLRYCVDFRCPNHYKCFESYCIPLHLVCDGVKDCPTGQDEDRCREFSCHGYFRCKGMHLCLHLNYLCDGVVDCNLYNDDELYCDSFQYPKGCESIGFTVTCISVTLASLQSISKQGTAKAIILTSSIVNDAMINIPFSKFPLALLLNLSDTHFAQNLHPLAFKHLSQLRVLDLTNVSIYLDKNKRFTDMDSLKHLFLIRTLTSTIYANAFQLPNLLSLHLQHSRIQYIEDGAFCCVLSLRALDLSYNKLEHLRDFGCLYGLHILDISNNKLSIINDAAMDNIAIVRFSSHIAYCCYLSLNTSCEVAKRTVSKVEIQNECQSILSHHTWIKVMYGFMGLTSTLLSIAFIVKMLLDKGGISKKTSKYIAAIAISDALNGIYLLIVLITDVVNELVTGWIAPRKNLLDILFFCGTIPKVSIIVTRFEHLLMTVGMYMATCHIFYDFEPYIRVTRLLLWLVCVSYCVIDIVFLRHVLFRFSVIWHPYQMTDFSPGDILSGSLIAGYELAIFAVIIVLCTRIYRSVARNENKINVNRKPKQYLVAQKLIRLTIGRGLITLLSFSLIVLLKCHLGLSNVVKQVLIALILPSSTIINSVMFYKYGKSS